MTAPYQDSSLPRNPEERDRATDRHPHAPLAPLSGDSMRGMVLPRRLWPSAKLGTLELPETGRGRRLAGPSLGLADTDPAERQDGAPALAAKPVYGPLPARRRSD